MIWLAGQARHSAIITDGEGVHSSKKRRRRKKNAPKTVITGILAMSSCAIHLYRGNKLRVVLTSFNHGGNWCIFAATSKLRGRSFCHCAFPPHLTLAFSFFLRSPPATCCSGRQSTAAEGKKATSRRKRRRECFGGVRWELRQTRGQWGWSQLGSKGRQKEQIRQRTFKVSVKTHKVRTRVERSCAGSRPANHGDVGTEARVKQLRHSGGSKNHKSSAGLWNNLMTYL